MSIQRGKITFDWDATTKSLTNVRVNGTDFGVIIPPLLQNTVLNIVSPFNMSRRFVFLDPSFKTLCNDVFEAIRIIKTSDNDDVLGAYLASRLFEFSASYWLNSLLNRGLYLSGIGFWQAVLEVTRQWEEANNPITVHKGTPLFFLAENYLLIGDRDNGFVYLYSALEDDKKLPQLGYPKKAPAYFTARMLDETGNQMYFLIRELWNKLGGFISKYRENYNQSFTGSQFESKFLRNDDLSDIVYFFVYNFLFLYDLDKNTTRNLLQNEFSRLKILDLVFNLSLIIDEVLKEAYRKELGSKYDKMFKGVVWFCNKKNLIQQTDLENYCKTDLKINDEQPDIVIPRLLSKTETYNGTLIKKEVLSLLISYHLRNHGGHNIDQQSVLTSKYDEIIEELFMALFLVVELL
ncbi:MAG: hypothetical protein ABI342_07445 [Nitrososphaera sp.]